MDGWCSPRSVIIFRFNSYDNLAKWENSEIRNQWIKKSKDLTEGEPLVEKQTGLEFWFTPRSSGAVAPAPPRYKMAIVVTAIIFVLINTLIPLIRQVTAELPIVVSTLVGTAIMVLLMTYVVMPSVTRVLRPWLSRKGLL
jgi:antibiotic biosynthesis monooxygenase (ABM) superfamily enzyme